MSWLAGIVVPWLLFGGVSALGSDGFLSPITDTVAELANRTVSASNSTYIIQLVPGSTLERFIAVHPSLASLVFSELRVGLFSAVIGTFDSPLLPYLARSFLVRAVLIRLPLCANSGAIHFRGCRSHALRGTESCASTPIATVTKRTAKSSRYETTTIVANQR